MNRILLTLLAVLPALPAAAQVSVDPGALDALQATPPARSSPDVRPVPHRIPPHREATARPGARPPAPPKQQAVLVPPAPPPAPIIPPAVAVPVRPAPPPPPVPVAADAPGAVAPLPDGVQVSFGAGLATLNPATAAALHDLARRVAADPAAVVDVNAYAAGSPDDPSTPRRLSLSRALAVRALLIGDGIASPRIYVRALGTDAGPGPADRADVTATATLPPEPPRQTATGPAAGPANGSAR